MRGDRPGSGASPFRIFLQSLSGDIEQARDRGQTIRFPEELLPGEPRRAPARRLLETLGVEIVAGDARLLEAGRAQTAELRRHSAESQENARRRLRRQAARHAKSVSAAAVRTANLDYRRKTA